MPDLSWQGCWPIRKVGPRLPSQVIPLTGESPTVWAALAREWKKADGTVMVPEVAACDVGYDLKRALAFEAEEEESRERDLVEAASCEDSEVDPDRA